MSGAPFVTLTTPLVTLPALLGLLIGTWGCVEIIAAAYGLDLRAAVPLVSIGSGLAAPLLLLGVAAFAFVQGALMYQRGDELGNEPRDGGGEATNQENPFTHPWGWLQKLAAAGAVLAFVAMPYWLVLPLAEVWVAAGAALLWSVVRWRPS